jgi:neutral amino acid transport system ATP-binding protein
MSELPPISSPESPASGEPYLVIKDLTAGYGGPPIIEGVTLEARAASITAIVGPNGAGKSTLMKAIAGVLRPSSGEIRVCGEAATGLTADKLVRRGMAYVPQVANVFPSLTVYENLEMARTPASLVSGPGSRSCTSCSPTCAPRPGGRPGR